MHTAWVSAEAHYCVDGRALGTHNGRLQEKYYESFQKLHQEHLLKFSPGALERL